MNRSPVSGYDNQTKRGVSVVLCCYNSSSRLYDTLSHLSKQQTPEGLDWEIIVVDNASTDNTSQLAFDIWQRFLPYSHQLRIVTEARPGQQYARIRGVTDSRYDLIVFCDDDNWLHPDYIKEAEQTMRAHPEAGAAGGQNLPATDAGSYPDWFESYRDKYALGIPAPKSGDITVRGFVLGAGMVTRRELFLDMYNPIFPSLLKGRNGEDLSTGDDFEYCKRLLLRDWQLYYEERLKLMHFLPRERLTIPYREKLMQGIRQAGIIINEYDIAVKIRNRYKNKNSLRLLMITPFRILLIRLGFTNRRLEDEQMMLQYLSPLKLHRNEIRQKIKEFIRISDRK